MKKTDLVIVQDTREQMPLIFPEAKVEIATLTTGDYSLKGFNDRVTIERKSLADLLQSLGQERERFMREVHRMRAYEFAGIVVETNLTTLYTGGWRSQMTPQSVIGSLQALSAKYGIHVLFADNRELAAKTVEGLLFHFLRKQFEYYERLKPLLGDVFSDERYSQGVPMRVIRTPTPNSSQIFFHYFVSFTGGKTWHL